ncbi:hypothetical protein EU803_02975 [Loktanella sp. IMCC34160]|uniref:hypothetical protein n=1 Tax=Loktanella sp. IMCC34160 TaxID=2510646 RepID=UPI00101B94A4|nr:hypothetical protein [Loktanella sp. IMCC34160]RYG93083.1 hypothetical protein EU803_02975 [Loktanella sp. IMCC34160]
MKPLPTPPSPRTLALPLRDLLRGVRQSGLLPRSVVGPALDALPPPLRHALEDITGTEAQDAELPADVIARASAALRSGNGASSDMAAALSHAITAQSPAPLVSETVVALCWRSARGGPDAAARFLAAMDDHPPFGEAPGFLSDTAPDATAARRRTLLSAILWLLADRAGGDVTEADLLHIAAGIATDLEPDASACWTDPATLQALLVSGAGRI